MYILTFMTTSKEAVNHNIWVYGFYPTINECIYHATNKKYKYAIYSTKWDFIQEV